MKRFSHRHGFDPNYTNQPISRDAPDWLKRLYFREILSPLLYVDGDNRYKNDDERPLGVKEMISKIAGDIGAETSYDDFDSWGCWDSLESRVMALEWYQFYDLVETVGHKLRSYEVNYSSPFAADEYERFMFRSYRQAINEAFSEHKVEWRLNQEGHLETAMPKDLEERVSSVEAQLMDIFAPARRHYAKARRYILSPEKDPENSIKESVSAVESVCRVIYPKSPTLGAALKEMRSEGKMAPLLISAFEKFYAYANAEPAVRHGSNVESEVLEMDAELALHMSAAFIRNIIDRSKSLGR